MSSKPVLYYTPRSPPCRAVMLTAAALGLELDYRLMNLVGGEHITPEFLKLNPQHTIPVLDDNGFVITDSHVICSYLVDKYGTNDSLYPKDSKQRVDVDARLYFDCGHLFPRVRFMIEPVIYMGASEIEPEKIAYMQKAYDGLEKCLQNSKYLCGNQLTIADLCCIATISSAILFAPIEVEKFPKLQAWVQLMEQLPYYNESNKQHVDLIKPFIEEKLKENKRKAEEKKA